MDKQIPLLRDEAYKEVAKEQLEEIKRLREGIETFIEKNFVGGSKADREDYVQMVSCKDIWELKQLIVDKDSNDLIYEDHEEFTHYRLGFKYNGEVLNYSNISYDNLDEALVALDKDKRTNSCKYDITESFIVEETVIRKTITNPDDEADDYQEDVSVKSNDERISELEKQVDSLCRNLTMLDVENQNLKSYIYELETNNAL